MMTYEERRAAATMMAAEHGLTLDQYLAGFHDSGGSVIRMDGADDDDDPDAQRDPASTVNAKGLAAALEAAKLKHQDAKAAVRDGKEVLRKAKKAGDETAVKEAREKLKQLKADRKSARGEKKDAKAALKGLKTDRKDEKPNYQAEKRAREQLKKDSAEAYKHLGDANWKPGAKTKNVERKDAPADDDKPRDKPRKKGGGRFGLDDANYKDEKAAREKWKQDSRELWKQPIGTRLS